MDWPPDELGHRAVQRLLQRITDPEHAGAPATQFVAARLTDRGSTAGAAPTVGA